MAKVGRPFKRKSASEIQPIIDKYFQETPKDERTITGLCIALDTFRQDLINYCNRAENGEVEREFYDTIKKAKHMVEHSYEIDLKKKGHTGTIFALKNFDWKDRTEVDNNVKVSGVSLDDIIQ